ncbi:MAG: autotransporter-associated beta strand repeat-containing protein [Verrucomicrobiae bacterium]|nr:autotransporter-associated beta strand repeat-containing protein [Verrucomicrobiae bacterium]
MKAIPRAVSPSIALALWFCGILPVQAAFQYWNPGGTPSSSGVWDTTTANWNNTGWGAGGNTTWVQGNSAAFTMASSYNVTVNTAITVKDITITGAAGTMSIIQTAANKLIFPAGLSTIDTGTRTVLLTAGIGFDSAATTTIVKMGGSVTAVTGILAVQPSANFSGKWIVKEGLLTIGSQGAFFGVNTADDAVTLDGGGITLSAGARTVLNTPIFIASGGGGIRVSATTATLFLNTKITGSGAFTIGTVGSVGMAILNNAANAFTQVAIANMSTRVGVAGALPSGVALTMLTGGTLDLNNLSASVSTLSGSAGTIQLGTATLTVSSPSGQDFGGVIAGSGGLTKDGSGSLILSGNNTYSGATTINAGTLQLGAGGTSGTVAGPIVNSGTLAWNRTDAATLSGVISGSGSLSKLGSGTLTLAAANTYSGPTTISAGQLSLGPSGSIANSTTIDVQSGSFFDVSAVTGGFSLASGQTLKGNGTVVGNVTANGTVSPGASIGQLTFNNNLILNGTTLIELDRLGSPLTADLISAAAITFGGTLNIVNIGTALQAGDTFNIFDGVLSGSFSTINAPSLDPGLFWDFSDLDVGGTITVVIPEPSVAALGLMGGVALLWLVRRRAA